MSKSYSHGPPGQGKSAQKPHKSKPIRSDAVYRDETNALLPSNSAPQYPANQSWYSDSFSAADSHSLSPLLSQSVSFSPLSTPSQSPVRGGKYYRYQQSPQHHHGNRNSQAASNTPKKNRLKKLLLKATYYGNLSQKHRQQNDSSSDGEVKTPQVSGTSDSDSSHIQQNVTPENHYSYNSDPASYYSKPLLLAQHKKDYPANKDDRVTALPPSSGARLIPERNQVSCSKSMPAVSLVNSSSPPSYRMATGMDNTDVVQMSTFKDSAVNNGYSDTRAPPPNTTGSSSLDNRPLTANMSVSTDEENNLKAKIGGLSLDSDISFIDGE